LIRRTLIAQTTPVRTSVSTRATQVYPDTMQTMKVQIPDGMKGGEMQVNTPAGMMNVAIPEGMMGGDTFTFQYQAPAPQVAEGVPMQGQSAVVMAMPVAPVVAMPAVHAPVWSGGPQQPRPQVGWKKGICDCFNHKDCGIVCCCATACPCLCCAYPTIEGVAGVRQEAGGWLGECCIISGIPDVALSFVGLGGVAKIVGQFIMRRSLINKYSLIEGGCETYCCVFWCGPCAFCQQTNEMFEQENLVFDGCIGAKREGDATA